MPLIDFVLGELWWLAHENGQCTFAYEQLLAAAFQMRIVAAASALILLPAIFVTLEKAGLGAVGGRTSMAKRLGLGKTKVLDVDVLDAALADDVVDAW